MEYKNIDEKARPSGETAGADGEAEAVEADETEASLDTGIPFFIFLLVMWWVPKPRRCLAPRRQGTALFFAPRRGLDRVCCLDGDLGRGGANIPGRNILE